jgi:hypothetical protein
MARRHAPTKRWHIGDACQVPYTWRYGDRVISGWSNNAEVVSVRGDRVVVRWHRHPGAQWEHVYPWWELRVPPKPRAYCRWRYHQ